MVKLIICVNRKPGMEIEEFHNYWREHHGGLYKTIPALGEYVRKYTQCHTVSQAYETNAAPYDGVAELWFDDFEAIDKFLTDPEYLAKVRPDEKKFCNFETMVWFVVNEEPVIAG